MSKRNKRTANRKVYRYKPKRSALFDWIIGLLGALLLVIVVLFATGIVRIETTALVVRPEDYPVLHLIESGAPVADIQAAIDEGLRRSEDDGELLTAAIERDRADVVNMLLKHGIAPDGNGRHLLHTPLCLAIERENLEIVKLLLAAGADPNSDQALISPRDAAEQSSNEEIKSLIRQAVAASN